MQERLVGDVMDRQGSTAVTRGLRCAIASSRRARRRCPRRSSRTPGWRAVIPFDVRLVDHGLVPGARGGRHLPSRTTDRPRSTSGLRPSRPHRRPIRSRVRRGHAGGVPVDPALDRLGIRVDQQLCRVEAETPLGCVRPVDAVAVPLARPHSRQEAMPVECSAPWKDVPDLRTVRREQAELDPLGVLGEQREVRALALPGRPERKGPPRPHQPPSPGASQRTPSGGRVTSADHCWPFHGWASAATAAPGPTSVPP